MESSNSSGQQVIQDPQGGGPQAIARMWELFFHRADAYATMEVSKKTGKPGYYPVCRLGKPWTCGKQVLINPEGGQCGHNCESFSPMALTAEVMARHLAGKVTLGAYLLGDDDTCKMGVIDVDIDQEAANPERLRPQCRQLALLLYRICQAFGLAVWLEDSGSKGYHIWIFLSDPLPAAEVQRLGLLIQARAEEELHAEGIHTEVFPKQGEKKAFGNLIKVPLSVHRKTGRRCLFLDPETFEPYPDQTRVLLGIEPNSPKRVRESLEEYEIEEAPVQKVPRSSGGSGGRSDPPGPALVDDPIGAILENCQRARALLQKAREEGHLFHGERIFLANLFGSIGQTGWAIDSILSLCSDFDRGETEKQFASLKGKGPLCLPGNREGDPTACLESCEKIKALGKKSPVAFAYQRGGGEGSPEENLSPVRKRIEEALEAGTIEAAFDAAESLSRLPADEYGKTKAKFKKLLGKELNLNDLDGAVREAREQAARKRAQEQRSRRRESAATAGLPDIEVSGKHLREVTAESLRAILRRNHSGPEVFVRGGYLTRIKIDENGRALAEPLTLQSARGILERSANFLRVLLHSEGISYAPIPPPLDVVNDLMALSDWPEILPLIGVTTAPVVAPDGTLGLAPGYQRGSRLYYHESSPLSLGDTTPTDEAVSSSKKLLLEELLIDFPFKDEASRANALALLLLPFVRPLISSPTALHLIDAPTPGTGKTLLADIVTLPFSPTGASVMTAGRDDDEWRKRITARLIDGPSHILIDNIQGRLLSADLAAAITAPFWSDRLLGQSKTITVPVRCCWMATGNNVLLSAELARRVCWIRLDAQAECPWERNGFRHPNLLQWAGEHRGELVTAALTLIRRWLEAGQPQGELVVGKLENWAATMDGLLKTLGVPGFMTNTAALYEKLDTERRAWGAFLEAWWDRFGVSPVGAADLFPLASTPEDKKDGEGLDLLSEQLGGNSDRSRRIRLGHLLKNKVDCVYGGLRILDAGTKWRAARYRLEEVPGSRGSTRASRDGGDDSEREVFEL